jgi:signal transduction histidine kinase/DNA-binding response OmpR family regulator
MALGTPAEVIFPEVWSFIGPEFERVRRGESFAIEDWLLPLARNGYLENCWFTVSYSPIRDETGGVGGLLAVVAETTGRVQSERRLGTLRNLARRAADAKTAEEACENAAAVFEQNPIDIPFSVFYLVEPGAEAARRIASVGIGDDAIANPARISLVATGGDESMAGWPLARVIQSGRAELMTDLPSRFGLLPGGPYPESTHTALLLPLSRPGAEHPYGILLAGVSPRRALDDRYRDFFDLAADHIVTAISNARAFEAERRRAEALAEVDRAKTAFFSNVSHEFRTPLTLLLGPTEDALRHPIPALAGESLQMVHRNALRLLKLVNSLLDFSRIEAGRVQALYQPTDLRMFTEDLVSGFRSAIERAGLWLEFNVSPELPQAFVDRQMWEKIVLNLLSNAFKFTFEGGIKVSLTLVEGRIELAVTDTGVGIPEKELPQLFERFHRVQGTRSRTHEGTGIGLALVQELVRLHGGVVRVTSVVERGSTFTVSIPAGSSHLPQDRLLDQDVLSCTSLGVAPFREEALRWIGDETGPAEGETAAVEATGRILIADDNSDMRSYLVRILGSRWTVEAVADGAAALAAIRKRTPDVVLTDIMMPGLDGLELLRALRSDPQTKDTRVVLLSARAGEEARVDGLDAGADDYLTKPFSARELIARVNSQLLIAQTHRRMSEHRNALYSLFMQAPAPIYVIRDQDLHFEMANKLYLQVAGRNDIVGKTLFEVFPEVRGQGIDDLLLGVMKTGEPFSGKEMLVRLDRGRGVEDVWFTFTYAPLTNANGVTDRVICLCHEVTDQVIARRSVEEASRAKDEFLSILGHELRNPLAPIVTALHVMKERRGSFEAERRIIDRQVKYMVRLVDDLLDVTRITRGKVKLHRKPVEIADVVSHAAEIVTPMIEEQSQRLTINVAPAGLRVLADEVRLAQVIANLLRNASQFTGAGGQIHLKAVPGDGEILLSVTDNGKGIRAELLPKIFDSFVQGERSTDESRGGLGLGLTIVKSLTELHGGCVSASSEGEGKGSEFTIRLPVLNPDSLEAGKPGDKPALDPALQAASRHRVLVVDDNRDGAEVMGIALQLEGHEVRVAYDGPAALGIAEDFRPTVVLLDIGLPLMDGYEIARRLRSMPGGTGMRLVAMSGYGLDSHRQRTAEAGFDFHLVKPVDFAELNSLLGEQA